MFKKLGFTIIEVIIVVVIIGVLAGLALPGYRIQTLKMKNQEATRVLMAIWELQKDYARENGGSYATLLSSLPMDFPASFKYFYLPVIDLSSVTCTSSPQSPLAYMEPLVGGVSYRLYVLEDGRIVCDDTPAAVGCPGALCARMGFPNW